MNEIFNSVNSPIDLKKLGSYELSKYCEGTREFLIERVSHSGGHLASNLGVVELTVALHRVFNTPRDKIVWDVGHQSYIHKLLTGRKNSFTTLRQYKGISGFPDPFESSHDAFGAGHAGTSVSAALGIALARDLDEDDYNVVAVIGDGSLGAGIALEAVNHTGHMGRKMTIILNDNGMSISPSVGSLYKILNKLRFNPRYKSAKEEVKKTFTIARPGKFAWALGKWITGNFKHILLPGGLWNDFGFTYLGPVDGHDLDELEAALVRARDHETNPTIIHVVTRKGKGYHPAEKNAAKYHGISPKKKNSCILPTYSQVFSNTLVRLMEENDRVVAITAAMLDGTGLTEAAERFPDRVFDVGICEQHAVTMAAGLASQGFIPVVAIYSTFLQRSYDQIIHDVCLQELPVIFAIDRAGIVGDDGKTHQGAFDLSFMRTIPNMIVSAPRDENEFQHLLYTAVQAGKPVSVRYPRGAGEGIELDREFEAIAEGIGEVLRYGNDAAIIAIGKKVYPALKAADRLALENIDCSVIDARFAKPLDEKLITTTARRTGRVLVIEENVVSGGFGSAVLELFSREGLQGIKVECLGLPDDFIEHGTQDYIRSKYNLDEDGIMRSVRELMSDEVLVYYEQKVENIG